MVKKLVFLLLIISPCVFGIGRTVGTKRIAIILYNFRNVQTQPITPELVRDFYFKNKSSLSDYYRMVSFEQLHLEGDVLGWYTIDSDFSCDKYKHYQEARLSAEHAGVNLNDYDYFFYLSVGVGFDSLGGLTCNTASAPLGGNEVFIQGTIDPIYGYDFRTPIHEFAHSLGVHHASNYRCEDFLGNPEPIGGNCRVTDEYGDPFTVMGKRPSINFLHNVHRAQLGWIREGEIEEVRRSGSYHLFPVSKNSSSPMVLKIPRDAETAYYLEYRQPIAPFDPFDPKDPVVNGVSIRLVKTSDPQTYLIDSTPKTNSFVDAPFLKDASLIDDANGVKIKVVHTSSERAKVKITLSQRKCVLGKPFLSLELIDSKKPSNGFQNYKIDITNTDSSSCKGPATFSIRGALPIGWSQSVVSIMPFKLLPGESFRAHLVVRAAQDAGPGIYEFTELVERNLNNRAPSVTYSVRAKYTISSK